jgi:rsbT co-antagonist protein RsbR
MDEMVDYFYEWLETRPEFNEFFSDSQVLERVVSSQREYWQVFFASRVDDDYIRNRMAVGDTHARIGLSLNVFFAGMDRFSEYCQARMFRDDWTEEDRALCLPSVTKLIHMDTAVVVEAYNSIVEERLTAQTRSLMEMSTPVTEIWKGILLLPLVGIIDSSRARDIMDAILLKISESQARMFILDIGGVGVVDTAVANHLIKITRATKLMGCECTISGVSPGIAQTIVDLGIDVGRVKTTANMMDALADAFVKVGLKIVKAGA